MKTIKQLAEEIQNTSPYENLHSLLGDDMGTLIYSLVEEAKTSDTELEILHDTIGELYEYDYSYPIVKECLNKIKGLRSTKMKDGFTEDFRSIILRCQGLRKFHGIDYGLNCREEIDKYSNQIIEKGLIDKQKDKTFAKQLCIVNGLRFK